MAKNVTNQTEPEVTDKTGTMCSKCEENPRRKDGSWCDECRAEQQRGYRNAAEKRARDIGFSSGVEAMRGEILTKFRGVNPGGLFRAGEIARMVAEMKAPTVSTTE